jgi:ribosomal protein L24
MTRNAAKGLVEQVNVRSKPQKAQFTVRSMGQIQLEEQVDNPNIKSLREEIGIMRVMLQQRFDMAKSAGELVLISGSVGEMIAKIGKLVQQCHRIEIDLGQLLDKTQAAQLAQETVTIIGKYVDDPDILGMIAEDLMETVERLGTNKLESI